MKGAATSSAIRLTLRRTLVVLSICAMVSIWGCVTGPQQKYLRSSDLRGIESVFVHVTSGDFKVYYEHGQGRPAPIAEFFGLTWILLVEEYRAGEDRGHARDIRGNTQIASAEAALLDEFARELRKNSILNVITGDTSSSAKRWAGNAVITLNIEEIALRRHAADQAFLEVSIHGELRTNGNEVLWQRDDKIQSRYSHPLDYYKQHGMPELESLIRQIAKRLAAEINYAQ